MSRSRLRFYLDENMDPKIANQLSKHGIDTVAAREANMLSVSDGEQLLFAIANGRVLCSKDSDFTKPEVLRVQHNGIVFFPDSDVSIGYVVNALTELYRNETAESMKNRLVYL